MPNFNSNKNVGKLFKSFDYDTNYYYDTSSKHKHSSKSRKSEIFDWLDVISVALVTVVLLFTFVFRVATIEGDSMNNTLHNSEKVVISDVDYQPRKGDIVVISRNYNNDYNKLGSSYFNDDAEYHEYQPIIKRIIAVAGDRVRIDFDAGVVYVNERQLKENYTATPTNNLVDSEQSEKLKAGVTVPRGCIFVLGDNRNNSLDSRSSSIGGYGNGMIYEKNVIGKVLFRIFPFSKIGGV